MHWDTLIEQSVTGWNYSDRTIITVYKLHLCIHSCIHSLIQFTMHLTPNSILSLKFYIKTAYTSFRIRTDMNSHISWKQPYDKLRTEHLDRARLSVQKNILTSAKIPLHGIEVMPIGLLPSPRYQSMTNCFINNSMQKDTATTTGQTMCSKKHQHLSHRHN